MRLNLTPTSPAAIIHSMRNLSILSGMLMLVSATALSAQAPRITPSGDPSVRSDSIYKLAVNPADYPDEPYVFLLDDGVMRVEADGKERRTYRQIVQILTRDAVERWGEQSFGYSTSRDKLTINWVRVVRLDGTVISAQPIHEQESLAEVAQTAPVYTDQHIRRVSLGGVAPGTIVDFSYTLETVNPPLPGDFFSGWSVVTGEPVMRSRFILDLPKAMNARIEERNVRFPKKIDTYADRVMYTWATKNVDKVRPEPFAGQPDTVDARITISGPVTWGTVARWYAALSKDRFEVTSEVRSAFGAVVGGATTREDSLRALHRWVAQDFRYVSLSLGIGGYRPRTPTEVYQAKYGDCKDKATLFVALARQMGVTAYPVLLSAEGGVDRDKPSISAFDHMIAAVQQPGKPGYLFLDLTADIVPYGSLPGSEHGEFALVVHPDGTAEEMTMPGSTPDANRTTRTIVGELTASGAFTGRYTEVTTGTNQYALRDAFSAPRSADAKDRVVRALANNIFPGATGDSLLVFDGRDFAAEPKVSFRIKAAQAASASGSTLILPLPIQNFSQAELVADLEARGPRRYPINAASVGGPREEVWEFKLTLPAGWRARLPEAVSDSSVFGKYTATYTQQGQTLSVGRTMIGRKGTEPPSKINELITWLKGMSKDDVRFIVLEKAGS
jgi:transglutaminase-like putative cysteine protease